jgi:5,10-methylenetetrahydromethanopterin reductase
MTGSAATRRLRLWKVAPALAPHEVAGFAARAESQGWDGVMFPDNQNLWGDTFVSMALASTATRRLLLANSATNPGTRHPAVVAAAAAAVAEASGGRAGLGIGRGDSALAHIGSAPVSVGRFAGYLSVVRRLLHGGAVSFAELEPWRPSGPVTRLGLRDSPVDSRLQWVDGASPVPIVVFASGPRVIEVAAQFADRVVFGLGAETERLAWGIDTARRACERAGRDPGELAFGAGLSVCVTDDLGRGRAFVSGIVASSARFSSMHGRLAGPASAAKRRIYESIAAGYDMNRHGDAASQVDPLTDEFIDEFAIVGPLEHCVERLRQIQALGIDDILTGLSRSADLAFAERADKAVVHDLIPAIRAPGPAAATAS